MVGKKLKVKPLEAEVGGREIVLHADDARELGLYAGARAKITPGKKDIIAIADITKKLVKPGEVGTFFELTEELKLKPGSEVRVVCAARPDSLRFVKKKMRGEILNDKEIRTIVEDIVEGKLSPLEMAAFVSTQYIRGMSMQEIASLARAMVETGERLEIDIEPIFDVHSIGGVPGNKYSLITVPIAAAAGLTVPKTSSRAVTSPAGTADVVETFANVELSLEEIKKNLKKVGAVLAWGGAVSLAPADDLLINVERPLGLDPRCQLLASVLSKKLAVGVDRLLIDIPTGAGAKIESMEEARYLAHDFMNLGHELNIQVETAITYGGQPVGYVVGPALEAREAFETLNGNGPNSLVEKATSLAGMMMETAGVAPQGTGKSMALEILESGKALKKMQEIVEAQGGDPKVKPEDIPIGSNVEEIVSPSSGYIKRIDNKMIVNICRAAGAPRDKGAGIRLFMKEGRRVKEGEVLLEIYADHGKKLSDAVRLAEECPPIIVESMLIGRVFDRPKKD